MDAPATAWIGDDVAVNVTTTNRGAAAGDAALRLMVDGREVATRVVRVPAGAAVNASFTLSLDRPGPHRVEVGASAVVVRARVPLPFPDPHDLADPGLPAVKMAVPFSGDLAYDPAGYRDFQRTIHGTLVRVPVHRGWDRFDHIGGHAKAPPEELAEFFFATFDTFWHLHGGFPLTEVRFPVHGPDDACRFGGAVAEGFPICARDTALEAGDASKPPHPLTRDRRAELLAHETLHAWNGGVIQYRGEAHEGFTPWQWFTEGATTYLAPRAVVTEDSLALYESEMQAALSKLARLDHELGRQSFAAHADASKAIEAYRREGDPHIEAIYARGTLVAYLLDVELARHDKTFAHFLHELYRVHGLGGIPFTSEELLRAANNATHADLRPFFDAYVFGAEPVRGPFGFVDHVVGKVRPAPGIRAAGVVTAHVSDGRGAPLAGVMVCAFAEGPPVDCRATDAAGRATLGLPVGAYRLRLSGLPSGIPEPPERSAKVDEMRPTEVEWRLG